MAPSDPTDNPTVETETLITQLRRKEGNWVQWGHACQTLQKAGMSPHRIFEETGFEPIHQNQVIVAAQVYDSIAPLAADTVVAHFLQRGSDVLYELRVLSRDDRARTAEFALTHSIDADAIRDVVKAVKEYRYLKTLPEGFADSVGDAVAYSYWKLARQQDDLQARSRLIAQGLRFAASASARQQVEKLLTDFVVVKTRPAPRLPVFRLDSDSELSCVIPVAGEWPLATEDFQAVPLILPEEPFGVVKFSGTGAYAPIPGWQVILQAEDPVGVLATSPQLPNLPNAEVVEPVMVVIDRARRDWDEDGYFAVDTDGHIGLQWFAEPPKGKLWGRVILVMRPKRILDEGYTRELWQFEE